MSQIEEAEGSGCGGEESRKSLRFPHHVHRHNSKPRPA
jgi:hypothetical protein